MKNKLIFFANSIKQSIVNKPTVFVLLILIFLATTICCSLPSREATSEIREKYLTEETYISFDMKADKFVKNRTAIFDYLLDKQSEMDGRKANCSIIISQTNCNIKINNVETFIDMLNITFAMKNDKLNEGNICEIGEYDAKKYGIVEGDILQLYGNDFVVDRIFVGTSGIWLPYNIKIDKWYSFESLPELFTGKTETTIVSGVVGGITHKDASSIRWQIQRLGCKIDNSAVVPIANSFILVLAMLIIGVVASTTILTYWLKCNSNKYSTYKTLGCKPSLLALAIIIETLIFALIAIGIGLVVDLILSVVMIDAVVISGFEWLHYLILIGGPLLSISIVTIIAVIMRAVAMPANTK